MLLLFLYPELAELFEGPYWFLTTFLPIWAVEGYLGAFPMPITIKFAASPNFAGFVWGIYAIGFSLLVHGLIIAVAVNAFNYAKEMNRSSFVLAAATLLLGVFVLEYITWAFFLIAIFISSLTETLGYLGIPIGTFLSIFVFPVLVSPLIFFFVKIHKRAPLLIPRLLDIEKVKTLGIGFHFLSRLKNLWEERPFVILLICAITLFFGYERYFDISHNQPLKEISVNVSFIDPNLCGSEFKTRPEVVDLNESRQLRLSNGLSVSLRDYYLGFTIHNNSNKSISWLVAEAEVFGPYDERTNRFSSEPITVESVWIGDAKSEEDKFRPGQYARRCVRLLLNRDYSEREIALLRIISKVEEVKW